MSMCFFIPKTDKKFAYIIDKSSGVWYSFGEEHLVL